MSIPQAGQTIRRSYEARVVSVRSRQYGYRIESFTPGSDTPSFTNVDLTGAPIAGGTIEIIVPVPAEPPIGSIIIGIGFITGRMRICEHTEFGWSLDNDIARGSAWQDGAWTRGGTGLVSVLGQFRTVIDAIGPDGQELDRTSWGVAP